MRLSKGGLSSLPRRLFHRAPQCPPSVTVGFSQSERPKRDCQKPKGFYNLASEITYTHLFYGPHLRHCGGWQGGTIQEQNTQRGITDDHAGGWLSQSSPPKFSEAHLHCHEICLGMAQGCLSSCPFVAQKQRGPMELDAKENPLAGNRLMLGAKLTPEQEPRRGFEG